MVKIIDDQLDNVFKLCEATKILSYYDSVANLV